MIGIKWWLLCHFLWNLNIFNFWICILRFCITWKCKLVECLVDTINNTSRGVSILLVMCSMRLMQRTRSRLNISYVRKNYSFNVCYLCWFMHMPFNGKIAWNSMPQQIGWVMHFTRTKPFKVQRPSNKTYFPNNKIFQVAFILTNSLARRMQFIGPTKQK